MHFRRLATALTTAALLLATAATPATAAVRAASDDTTNVREQLVDHMATLGITEATANALVDKLEAGLVPDSMTPGAVPVTTQKYRLNGTDYTRLTYADGSAALTSVQRPTANRTPGATTSATSLSGCVYTRSGTVDLYRNCLVSYNGIFSFDSHRADYAINRSSGYASVLAANTWAITVVGGTYRSVSLTIPRGTQTATLPAYSRLSYRATYTFNGNTVIDTLCWTELRVKGWSATVAAG